MYYSINDKLFSTSTANVNYGKEINPTDDQLKYGIVDEAKINELKFNELKLLLKQKAKLQEAETINRGFTFKNLVFDCDEKAQGFISALLTAVNADLILEQKGFTSKENTDVDLDAQDIKDLAICCLGHVASAHKRKRDLYKEIDSCLTIEELEAIHARA